MAERTPPEVERVTMQIAAGREMAGIEKRKLREERQRAQDVERRLKEQERSIPVPTQKSLRAGLYSGLEGRRRRKIVEAAKQEIAKRKKGVELFKKGLSKQEKNISEFEKGLTKKEADVRTYMKKLAEQQKLASDVRSRRFAELQSYLSSDGMVYDIEGNLIAIDTGEQSVIPTPFEKEAYKKEPFGMESPGKSFSIGNVRDLDRTEVTKVRNFPGFSITGDFIKGFRTTGSPIRVTKVTSLQSRGHHSYEKPIPKPKKKIYKDNIRKVKQKEKKDFFGVDKEFSLLGKGKRKKSFWGL